MIIKSKIAVKLLSLNFAKAITVYPFIFIKHTAQKIDARLINHEKIHLRQQLEMLIIPFYLWYFIEYLFRRIKAKSHYEAYRNISFEREAYCHENNLVYLKTRKLWGFFKYLKEGEWGE